MPHTPIVLIEFDFDSLEAALAKPLGTRIAAADAHTARLTDGARVFLISPYDPELDAEQTTHRSTKPRSRSSNLEKRRERSQQVDYR